MKSTLYKKAAELIFENSVTEFSCNALVSVNPLKLGYGSPEIKAYTNLFNIPEFSTFRDMFNDLMTGEPSDKELREIRIYALLFAYEIFKAEKKSFVKSYYNKRR